MHVNRRRLLTAAVTLTAVGLAACSGSRGAATSQTTPDTVAAASWPVTVEHIYGTTTIAAEPQRVATVSWVNPDIALALGVVPVGVDTVTWGNNDAGSTDWFDARLAEVGGTTPTHYDTTNGIDYDGIAESTPDVILAAYSGLTQEEYDKLSKIAPVVGPGVASYMTPWQQSTRMTAKALGREAAGEELVADVEAQIKAQADAHPEFADLTGIAGNVDPTQNTLAIYGLGDNRSQFMTDLGITVADFVSANQPEDSFYFDWSPERANELDSDLLFTWLPSGTTAEAIAADPVFGQIPAVQSGGLVVLDSDPQVLSISAASPLSLPWALDVVVPKFTEAAAAVKGA